MADKPSTKQPPAKPEPKKPASTPAPKPEPKAETPTKPEVKSEPEKAKATPQPDILEIVQFLVETVKEHENQITELKEALARKRKAVPNGKVQIKDTKTGKVYPSKNGTYKALLKAGELKDLVEQGVFGEDPTHNNFGWYALEKAYPGRFEQVKEEKPEQASADAHD